MKRKDNPICALNRNSNPGYSSGVIDGEKSESRTCLRRWAFYFSFFLYCNLPSFFLIFSLFSFRFLFFSFFHKPSEGTYDFAREKNTIIIVAYRKSVLERKKMWKYSFTSIGLSLFRQSKEFSDNLVGVSIGVRRNWLKPVKPDFRENHDHLRMRELSLRRRRLETYSSTPQ